MLEPVIGLEIHLQLKTKSKMFCGCAARETDVPPNTNICPVCMAHPGTLPVPNEEAIRLGIKMGLALHGTIAPASKFDRKNYFYPDLPKGYQISQYDLPLVSGGWVDIDVPSAEGTRATRISITRAHLEEDAAKSFHGEDGKTYVDFNRAGTPLLETVTGPDFRTPQEAKVFLQEIRLIARTLGISDADMEKGHMRCDANVSLRERDTDGNIVGLEFHPKTEVKNINSFRNVERALAFEIERQTKLWNAGSPPAVSTTRGWDDTTQTTKEQRTKEAANDYRFFPEPDIPVLALSELADAVRQTLPELPSARRHRFVEEYAFKPEDARQMVEEPTLADYVEQSMSELGAWLQSNGAEEESEAGRRKLANLVSGWLLSKLGGLLAERSIDWRLLPSRITPENFGEFIELLANGKLNSTTGLKVLTEMLESKADPSTVMEEKRLGSMEDTEALAAIVDRVLSENPDVVERYKAGKPELLNVLLGKIMRETEGTAEPGATKKLLIQRMG